MSEIPSIDEQGQREFAFQEAFRAAPAPVVTYALIAVNAAVFLAMLFTSSSFPTLTNPQMLRWGADFGPLTLNGQSWRMLTSCFLHFGFIHIGMNMFILYQVGVLTEKLFGNVRFLVLYLLAGLGGSVVSLFSHPLSVSAGASGAVFGVYGGLLGFLLVQRGVVPTRVSLGIGRSAGVFLVYNLVWGLSSPGTDIQAHGGGLVSGLILGCVLARPMLPTGQKLYPLRTLVVAAVGLAVIYAAEQRLPRPDASQGLWVLRLSGSERFKVGENSEIFYDGTATKADAQALATALTKEGFFTKTGELVLLHKGADGTAISIPTNADDGDDGDTVKPWDDPQVLAWAQILGARVAPSVGGPPIRMEILSAQGKVRKVLPIAAQ
jgi:rhomboid protease GluP